MDPLVSAIAVAIEETLDRGIEVKPLGDGWFIRVAPVSTPAVDDGVPTAEMRRSW